jgi:hypothetical protein
MAGSSFSDMLAGPMLQQAQAEAPPAGVMDQAYQQFPILKDVPLVYKESPGKGGNNLLESWPPGEEGDKDYPRPKEFPLDKLGVENYSPKTRPIDILGDVVSHHLVNTDPQIQRTYSAFQKSITPSQEDLLKEQYKYAQQSEGEKRDFDAWKESTGVPALFRGHAFQQWPSDFNKRVYTPQQRELLDKMMMYLQGQQ